MRLRPCTERAASCRVGCTTTRYRECLPTAEKNKYAGIGEFHAFGDDIDLPVLQAVIALAKEHQIFLHAHSDANAIDRIFATYPNAIVLWAHSGFDSPQDVAQMLSKHDNLWADLAFRSEHTSRGEVTPEWKSVFEQFEPFHVRH